MGSAFKFSASYTADPNGNPSLPTGIGTPICEAIDLSLKQYSEYPLGDDNPHNVAFGGIANAQVLVVKVVGSKVRVRITSADGAQQSVPVDDLLVLVSQATPITAIDLTRLTGGADTIVGVFLGAK